MKTYTYYAVMVDYSGMKSLFGGDAPDGKRLGAWVERIGENENILCVLDRIGGIVAAHAYHSKRRAQEVVDAWNKSFRRNGTYAF